MDSAIELAPEHISLYELSIEEGTRFSELCAEGKLAPVGEDEQSRCTSWPSSSSLWEATSTTRSPLRPPRIPITPQHGLLAEPPLLRVRSRCNQLRGRDSLAARRRSTSLHCCRRLRFRRDRVLRDTRTARASRRDDGPGAENARRRRSVANPARKPASTCLPSTLSRLLP